MDLTQAPFNVGDRVRIDCPGELYHMLDAYIVNIDDDDLRPFYALPIGRLREGVYGAEELVLVERAS